MKLGKICFLNSNPLFWSFDQWGMLPHGVERSTQKRPELGGRYTNSSNHSKNSLCSNSFSYFVIQIAFRNPKLNVDSKNLHSYKYLLVRNVFVLNTQHRPLFVLTATDNSSNIIKFIYIRCEFGKLFLQFEKSTLE